MKLLPDIKLSSIEWRKFMAAVKNPPKATDKLKELLKRIKVKE